MQKYNKIFIFTNICIYIYKLFTLVLIYLELTMTGEEMKTYLRQRGLSLASVAEELGTSPQNLNGKLKAKSLKSDFISAIKAIIDRCAPPLPAEMEEAVFGSNINDSNSSNVSQSIGSDAALAAENKLLREQNEFLQSQVKTLLAIVGQR
nr:MAG TPA: Transcriptional regulator BINDING, PHEROMONE BINDING, REPEAT [Caudoviricetes sp.]